MTTTDSKVKYTHVPQEVVDMCLSRRDAAYRESDTIAVFLDVQVNSISLTVDKLNSKEQIVYTYR